ncbi:MAG: hypothetical protein AAB267_01480 [Candidatus Desantisbacteria bacterium]
MIMIEHDQIESLLCYLAFAGVKIRPDKGVDSLNKGRAADDVIEGREQQVL